MTTHAFIFARGGSKGLSGKNIKKLAGKPLIQYSIEVAQNTPEIDQIYVSTDDEAIANIAQQLGATIIKRPKELAEDDSSEWDAWIHAIEYVKRTRGDFDLFVSLPATSPLRSVVDVTGAIQQLRSGQSDICISITAASRSPFFNMVKKNKDELVELVNSPKREVYRRQDAPEVFDITTVVYAALPEFILKKNRIFDGRVSSIEVPKERAVDIDDIYDFRYAEAILREKGNL